MKNLTDVYEKLDLNKVNLNDKFPVNGNIKEIIKFLKTQRFEELDDKKIDDYGDYFIEMNKMTTKVYSFAPDNGDNIDSLVFTNTSEMKISDKNPLFHILYYINSKKFKYELFYKYGEYQEVSKKIFLEKIAQLFGWDI